ncbi:hypothetical protein F5878DRAFT_646370, partial [Lentinula raphanica]
SNRRNTYQHSSTASSGENPPSPATNEVAPKRPRTAIKRKQINQPESENEDEDDDKDYAPLKHRRVEPAWSQKIYDLNGNEITSNTEFGVEIRQNKVKRRGKRGKKSAAPDPDSGSESNGESALQKVEAAHQQNHFWPGHFQDPIATKEKGLLQWEFHCKYAKLERTVKGKKPTFDDKPTLPRLNNLASHVKDYKSLKAKKEKGDLDNDSDGGKEPTDLPWTTGEALSLALLFRYLKVWYELPSDTMVRNQLAKIFAELHGKVVCEFSIVDFKPLDDKEHQGIYPGHAFAQGIRECGALHKMSYYLLTSRLFQDLLAALNEGNSIHYNVKNDQEQQELEMEVFGEGDDAQIPAETDADEVEADKALVDDLVNSSPLCKLSPHRVSAYLASRYFYFLPHSILFLTPLILNLHSLPQHHRTTKTATKNTRDNRRITEEEDEEEKRTTRRRRRRRQQEDDDEKREEEEEEEITTTSKQDNDNNDDDDSQADNGNDTMSGQRQQAMQTKTMSGQQQCGL